jgi:hypothetical protein
VVWVVKLHNQGIETNLDVGRDQEVRQQGGLIVGRKGQDRRVQVEVHSKKKVLKPRLPKSAIESIGRGRVIEVDKYNRAKEKENMHRILEENDNG